MRKLRGFTLIELLVVIFIISILATMVVINVSSSRVSARDARRKADLRSLQTAIEMYIQKTGNIPTSAGWCAPISYYVVPCGAAPCWQDDFKEALVPQYLVLLPHDPLLSASTVAGDYYFVNYKNEGYALYSNLENTSDSEYGTYQINTRTDDPPEGDGYTGCTADLNYLIYHYRVGSYFLY